MIWYVFLSHLPGASTSIAYIGFSTRLQLRRYLQAESSWSQCMDRTLDTLPPLSPLEVQDKLTIVIEANCSRVCPRNALLDFEPDCYAFLFVKRFRDFIYFCWTYYEHMNISRNSKVQWIPVAMAMALLRVSSKRPRISLRCHFKLLKVSSLGVIWWHDWKIL